MGLDINVGDEWILSCPYSTFNDWRDHLLEVSECKESIAVNPERRNGYGYWRHVPEEIMSVLMIHHDDIGYIFPREAKVLRMKLKGLVAKISPEWKVLTRQFIRALFLSAKTGEPVEFC